MADFEIYVVSQEYGWEMGSSTRFVDMDGNAFDLVAYLRQRNLQALLSEAEDLIAVGAASCEGHLEAENERAKRRAMTLVAKLRALIPEVAGEKEIYGLSLGRHTAECTANGDMANVMQRLVIVAWVPRKQEGVLLDQALYRLMKRAKNLNLHPGDYSRFRLKKFT